MVNAEGRYEQFKAVKGYMFVDKFVYVSAGEREQMKDD